MSMLLYKPKDQCSASARIAWCLFVSLALLLFFCAPVLANEGDAGSKIEQMYDQYREDLLPVKEMSAEAAIGHYLGGERIVFIDVREPEERAVSTLPHALSVEQYLTRYPAYQDHLVLAYCTIGYRSGLFAKSRADSGQQVYNLRGGMLAWVHEGGVLYDGDKEVKRIHVYGAKWDLAPADYDVVKFPFWKILFK